MIREEQNTLNTGHRFMRLWFRISSFFRNTFTSIFKLITLLLYVCTCHFIVYVRKVDPLFEILNLESFLFFLFTIGVVTMIGLLLFIYFSYSDIDWKIHKACKRISFVNNAGETPILKQLRKRNNHFVMIFHSVGIPLSMWNNYIEQLENVLDITISEIFIEKNSHSIGVKGTFGKWDYTKKVYWHLLYQTYDSVLRIGESANMPVFLDLSIHPHILIGGSTGSGKTWMMKSILMQCLNKKSIVYIIDFKGGIDYPSIWHRRTSFITEEKAVFDYLDMIVKELHGRKNLFAELECRDIDTFSRLYEPMERIIVAVDEVAELTDMTGLDKEGKEQKKKILSYLNTIARLGRAFGIHLILGTQRPDADVLPGQIKNNISYKICGRADEVLSRIILDSTSAATRIPKNAQGVFMNQDGVVFKGYTFDENLDIIDSAQ